MQTLSFYPLQDALSAAPLADAAGVPHVTVFAGTERDQEAAVRLPHAAQASCAPASGANAAFNHAPATRGAVWEAARHGDTACLMAALAERGSTEEADGVSAALPAIAGSVRPVTPA